MTQNITGISYGSGVTWVSVEDAYRQFAPLGMSVNGFARWLTNIRVPKMHAPDGTKFVNLTSLTTAVQAISRIGQPDFLMPGSPAMRDRAHLRDPSRYTNKLDDRYFYDNWKAIIAEILAARRIRNESTGPEVRKALEEAAQAMAELCHAHLPPPPPPESRSVNKDVRDVERFTQPA